MPLELLGFKTVTKMIEVKEQIEDKIQGVYQSYDKVYIHCETRNDDKFYFEINGWPGADRDRASCYAGYFNKEQLIAIVNHITKAINK